MTLKDRLRQEFPNAKQQTLKRMVQNRRVRINGELMRRLDQVVRDGDALAIADENSRRPQKVRLPFAIVFEDRDIVVINKPAGLLTSTVPREPRPTAIAALTEYLAMTDPGAKAGLIHRLDRDASGLLIFSKNARAFASLKKQFFHHSVERIYHAVVSPGPRKDSGRIVSNLVERADGVVHSVKGRVMKERGQRAETEFEVKDRRGKFALVRIKLHTGRKHQIRVHFSEMGSPIAGDKEYGGIPHKKGLMLAAAELSIDHPRTGERMKFSLTDKEDPVFRAFMGIGVGSESI